MPRVIHELRDLRITKIALVRKGFRPVNDGARITIVKAEEDPTVSTPETATPADSGASVLERLAKAIGLLKSEPAADAEAATTEEAAADASTEGAADATGEAADAAADDTTATADATAEASTEAATSEADATAADASTEGAADAAASSIENDTTTEVAKSEPTATELALQAQIAELTSKLDAQIAKATADQSQIEQLAKAIEDFNIERARAPQTPNVTASIDPTRSRSATADAAARQEAVKGMTFGDAVRHLMRQ